MSAVVEHIEEAHAEGHAHPSDKTYWMVGLFLAVVTAAEIWVADQYSGFWASAGLLIMMVVKFGTVAAMFMHLRFDSKILRGMFAIGLVLALGCYAAAAGAMHFWDHEDGGVDGVIIDPVRDEPLPPEPTLPAPIPHSTGGH